MAMTLEYWDARFQPEYNYVATEEASFGGYMFETFGAEQEYVLNVNTREPERVWTYVDGDDGKLRIIAGCHFVNRIGYFVTRTPWSDDPFFQEVELEVSSDDSGE